MKKVQTNNQNHGNGNGDAQAYPKMPFPKPIRHSHDRLKFVPKNQDNARNRGILSNENQISEKSKSESNLNQKSPIANADNIRVCVRVRPFTVGQEDGSIWKTNALDSTIELTPEFMLTAKKKLSPILYDSVFYGSDNKILFDAVVKESIISCMTGINTVVFAYGQSGSGKTYSMMGYEEMPGIIPQSIDQVFDYIRNQPNDREYLLRVSYIEIYNEKVRDLLDPARDGNEPKLLESKNEVYISPLKEELVYSPAQVMSIIRDGEKNRSNGETENNQESSRSHTIFQMIIECITVSGKINVSKLSLIDLAGSERAPNDLERRKEGAYINRSLLTLGTVISKLTDRNEDHIPYRDSKLTRLLQKTLSGVSKVCVVATLSPVAKAYDESANTLKFASRVKKIIARPGDNQLDDKAMLQKYKTEVELLRTKLHESKAISSRLGSNAGTTSEERQKYADELLAARLESSTLKDRIAFLNKIILKATTMSAKPLLDWNMGESENSVVLAEGLLPARKRPEKSQSTPEIYQDVELSAAEKLEKLQDFLGSLLEIQDVQTIHKMVAGFKTGSPMVNSPSIDTAVALKKISRLEEEKSHLNGIIKLLEKKVADIQSTVQFEQNDHDEMHAIVEDQFKAIEELQKKLRGAQIEFNEYRKIVGRRRPPRLGKDAMFALKSAALSGNGKKEADDFLEFLASIEETEQRLVARQHSYYEQKQDSFSIEVNNPIIAKIKESVQDSS